MAGFLYAADGFDINDSWYLSFGGRYWAYYLQYPENGDPAGHWTRQSIGLSVSDDLKHWEYVGTVLEPDPDGWDRVGLATGSAAVVDGAVRLLYTGNGERGKDGFGLAVGPSPDRLKRYGTGPVVPRGTPVPFSLGQETVRLELLADPYVYPEPVDGTYYAFVNAHATDRPVGKRGCIAVLRSKDWLSWEPADIAVLSDEHDRLETPQVWFQDGQWLLYFGAVYGRPTPDGGARDVARDNRIYVSDRFTRGYRPVEGSVLRAPDGIDFYIGKSVETFEGERKFLVNRGLRNAHGPYRVVCDGEGIRLCDEAF